MILILSALLGWASPIDAQRPSSRPKVGLVLSGGGAKGLAHIGVIKVLEEAGVPVDVVTGTSMGSIIGALYAIGYSPEFMENFALETDWLELFDDRLSRRHLSMQKKKREDRYLFSLPITGLKVRLPSGLVAGHKIHSLFSRMTWPALGISDFKNLPRPFACVATDIASGEAVVIDHGTLPDAMRSSMAIPSAFTPIRRGEQLLVDGGLVRNLPAEDAIALGADIIIGVDVSSELLPADSIGNFIDIADQSVTLLMSHSLSKQRALCDILISPDMTGLGTFDFDNASDIIQKGEEAARQVFDRLTSLADTLDTAKNTVRSIDAPQDEPVEIAAIEIRGLRDVSSRLVLTELGIAPPAEVTPSILERAIERLYSSGFFKHVAYMFEAVGDDTKLVIVVEEDRNNYLHMGLRYDTHWGVGLLLNASFNNIIGHGSLLGLELSLDERKRANAEYALHTGLRSRLGVRLDVDYIHDHIDVYDHAARTSHWKTQTARLGFFLETVLSRVFYAAAGMNGEWYKLSPSIGPTDLAEKTGRLVFASGDLWLDTLDRSWFPRSGTSLKIRGELAGTSIGSEESFNRTMLQWLLCIPVHGRVTLAGRFNLGSTEGDALPLHYNFFAGGIHSIMIFQDDRSQSLHGYHHQELAGRHLFTTSIAIQVEAISSVFLTAYGNIGNAVQERTDLFREERVLSGGGIGVGVATPGGPIEYTLSFSKRNDAMSFIRAGYSF